MATTVGSGVWIAKGVHKQSWSQIPNGNQTNPLTAPQLADKSVAVNMNPAGAGGSCSITGSDNGVDYFIMHDINGVALTFTADGIKQIAENPLHIRAEVTAGDASTRVDVDIISKGTV